VHLLHLAFSYATSPSQTWQKWRDLCEPHTVFPSRILSCDTDAVIRVGFCTECGQSWHSGQNQSSSSAGFSVSLGLRQKVCQCFWQSSLSQMSRHSSWPGLLQCSHDWINHSPRFLPSPSPTTHRNGSALRHLTMCTLGASNTKPWSNIQ